MKFKILSSHRIIAAGALYGLCFTNFDNIIIKLPLFFLVIREIVNFLRLSKDNKIPSNSFFNGWFFGIAFFIISFWGIKTAFFVVEKNILFFPSLVLLSSGLGLLFAFLFFYVAHTQIYLQRFSFYLSKNLFFLIFPIFWVLFEFLKCELFQVPLNIAAHLFCFQNSWFSERFIQIANKASIYSVSFVLVFFLSSLLSKSRYLITASSFLFFGTFFYGHLHIEKSNRKFPKYPPLKILLIQPNIEQKLKIDTSQRSSIFWKTLNLVKMAQLEVKNKNEKIDLIILPETSLGFPLEEGTDCVNHVKKHILNPETIMILGADRIEKASSLHINSPNSEMVWYNSMFVLSKEKILDVYDKVKLMPFGEYIPFRYLFPSFFNYVLGGIDCSPGKKNNPISIEKIPPFLPKICSESLFTINLKGAKWILVILNNGWFDNAIKKQHLAADRLRAVEAGVPMLRASNNGISCLISSTGRIIKKLPEPEEVKSINEIDKLKNIKESQCFETIDLFVY